MPNFADRVVDAVEAKRNPCVVGLDPRVESIPPRLRSEVLRGADLTCQSAAELMRVFCREVIDIVARRVSVAGTLIGNISASEADRSFCITTIGP